MKSNVRDPWLVSSILDNVEIEIEIKCSNS